MSGIIDMSYDDQVTALTFTDVFGLRMGRDNLEYARLADISNIPE
jgi:hypothetical protein